MIYQKINNDPSKTISQNGYLEKYFQEFITSTTNEGRDSADTNLIKKEVVRPLKSSKGKGLDSDEGNSKCIMFMKLANNNKVVLKHREIFRECFESMLKWFHNTYIDGDVTKLMPLTIGGYEICLFDLYKLVKCFGGYERLNYKMKWDEVSLGFGFSGLYGLRFKEIYVHYLLIPETYFEVAKVGLTRYKSRLGTDNEHQAGKGRLELHLIKTSEEDSIAVYNIRGVNVGPIMRCVLMAEMEALGGHKVAGDSLECLKETQARETNRLVALIEILIEARAGIREKKGHVTMMDLND
ncbi:bulb-type lectin domain-containing protein [Tanacetum coccineum]|uniref:Bulb-type lectin domain-containing protein n=1 Tax=Tanacetum coccineum TaxID=301880 RepID=A0ABQ4X4G2_9ASTR